MAGADERHHRPALVGVGGTGRYQYAHGQGTATGTSDTVAGTVAIVFVGRIAY